MNLEVVQVAVVGATGLVGLEIQKVLKEKFSKEITQGKIKIHLLASQARVDENVLALADSWDLVGQCKFVLNATSAELAQEIKSKLKPAQVLIDNSSGFRMNPEVPLVVPEVNASCLGAHEGVIANPNCTAIILTVALKPLMEIGFSRVIVSTYQAASGAGIKGLEELEFQLENIEHPEKWSTTVFNHPLANNVLSHNTAIRPEGDVGEGYNDEEWKVIEESRKILGIPHLQISATCVRVPVKRAHTESVTVDLKEDVPLRELRALYANASGIKIVDDWEKNHFPMPVEASNQDLVLLGRLRKDVSNGRTIHLLIAGDQIRKGAATNAVQIMENLIHRKLH